MKIKYFIFKTWYITQINYGKSLGKKALLVLWNHINCILATMVLSVNFSSNCFMYKVNLFKPWVPALSDLSPNICKYTFDWQANEQHPLSKNVLVHLKRREVWFIHFWFMNQIGPRSYLNKISMKTCISHGKPVKEKSNDSLRRENNFNRYNLL